MPIYRDSSHVMAPTEALHRINKRHVGRRGPHWRSPGRACNIISARPLVGTISKFFELISSLRTGECLKILPVVLGHPAHDGLFECTIFPFVLFPVLNDDIVECTRAP